MVGAMVLTNQRDNAVIESLVTPVPVMPVVSVDQRISTSWFCLNLVLGFGHTRTIKVQSRF